MSVLPASSTRQERRWVISIIITAIIVSSLPYIFGALRAGTASTYLWANPFGPADTNVYFSMMKQSEQGRVFLENLYTGEPQHGSLFQPLWLVLGWVAGLGHVAIPVVFHVARIIMGGLFLFTVYRLLICPLFSEERQRILAMLVLVFSSGIGTFFSLGVNTGDSQQIQLLLPTDQWVSESSTLLTLVHSPLFILAQLLLVVVLVSFVRLRKETRLFFIAMVALLAIVHPYDIVTIAVLLPVFFVIRIMRDKVLVANDRKLMLWSLVLAGLAALSPLLAFVVASDREQAIRIWTQQNITLSPMPHSYLIGYGLLVPFAVIGWMAWRRSTNPLRLLILTWVVTSIVLLYIPIQINRRFSNGLHIPLALLATVGIDLCWTWIHRAFQNHVWRRYAAVAIFGWVAGLGLFLSSAVTIVCAMSWEVNPAKSIYHIPRDEARAIQWLEKGTPSDAIILAHPYIGNIIPAMTGRRVYLGHGHQTINWESKVQTAQGWFFLTNTDDEAKHRFLTQNNITYLLFGPYEARVGKFNPTEKSYLVPVHRDGDVTVYRVLP